MFTNFFTKESSQMNTRVHCLVVVNISDGTVVANMNKLPVCGKWGLFCIYFYRLLFILLFVCLFSRGS
jgi:hypothetical protein